MKRFLIMLSLLTSGTISQSASYAAGNTNSSLPADLTSFRFLIGKWNCAGDETLVAKKRTTKLKAENKISAEFQKELGWIQLKIEITAATQFDKTSHQVSFLTVDSENKKPVIISMDDGRDWDIEKSQGWEGSEVSFKATDSSREERAWTKIIKNSDDQFELDCGFDNSKSGVLQSCKKNCVREKGKK